MPPTTDATEVAATFLHLIQRFVGTQPDALDQMRKQVQQELALAEEAVVRARAQLTALDQLQSLIDEAPASEEAVGGSAPPNQPRLTLDVPPLRKAILLILNESPREPWTRDRLLAELTRRGWAPGGKTPRNTFISRLSDLAHDGLIDRLENGEIRLRDVEADDPLFRESASKDVASAQASRSDSG